ncbi:MAG: hypothetical protein U5L95_04065 [Candidatus Saccharibacteria bacterium]|nr:hypothetical protein [Candidatus Saccharibacteria bacterium]
MMEIFVNFLNSNFLQTFVTFIVGLFAFLIYRRQKNDRKVAAANSIFLEIQHIESCIPKLKEATRRGSLNLDLNIIRDDSWSKYSHLFSSNFDKDEWETITDFYQNAKVLDESIKASAASFDDDIRQIRYNKQRMFAEITKDFLDNTGEQDTESQLKNYNQRMEIFDKLYMSRQEDFAAYTPVKYMNDAKKALEDMEKLSITTIGKKFKDIIGAK